MIRSRRVFLFHRGSIQKAILFAIKGSHLGESFVFCSAVVMLIDSFVTFFLINDYISRRIFDEVLEQFQLSRLKLS